MSTILIDSPFPDPTSGDPGGEFHKLPAPSPVSVEAMAGQLSSQQINALNALAAGQSVREAAKSSGVSRTTVYKWLRQDPHFRAAFNAWKEELLESGQARLLKGSDAAIKTLLKSIADGDAQSAVALLKGVGMLAAQRPGLTDPAMVNRELELDRRQHRVDLAVRSRDVAKAESDCLRRLSYRASEEESDRNRREREEWAREEAERRKLGSKPRPIVEPEKAQKVDAAAAPESSAAAADFGQSTASKL